MTTVLYLGGCTRSGSTVIDRALGQLPGVLSTGEFGLITTHGIVDNRLCGCGARFRDCAFWIAVGRLGFGGWDTPEARELVGLHARVTRQRYIPFILGGAPPGFHARLARYRELLARLYRATAQIAEVEIVVDSTKAPAYAFVLLGTPGLDVRIAHLVRDSRGTAYSASKQQQMRDSVDRPVMKHRYPPLVITARWDLYHLLFSAASHVRDIPLVRYEDFVRRPAETLRQLAAHAGTSVSDEDLAFVTREGLRLGAHHTTAGSDMRLDSGLIRLREDDEWRRKLSPTDRRLVTAASWPLLRRWGYL